MDKLKIHYLTVGVILGVLTYSAPSAATIKNVRVHPNFSIEPLSRTNEEEAEVIYLKASDYMKQGFTDQAELLLKIALENDPSHIHSCFHLASIYFSSGRSQMAKEVLEKGVQLNPKSTILGKLLAKIYVKYQLPGKAIQLLTSYPENLKLDVDFQGILASAYLQHGLFEAALKQYDYLLRLDPTYSKGLLGKALALEHLDKLEDAKRQYLNIQQSNGATPFVINHVKERLSRLEYLIQIQQARK